MVKAKEADSNLTTSDELGGAEVQQKVDDAEANGFYGVKVDPIPDEEYSLLTGPNSPSTVDTATARATQHSLGADTDRSNS